MSDQAEQPGHGYRHKHFYLHILDSIDRVCDYGCNIAEIAINSAVFCQAIGLQPLKQRLFLYRTI